MRCIDVLKSWSTLPARSRSSVSTLDREGRGRRTWWTDVERIGRITTVQLLGCHRDRPTGDVNRIILLRRRQRVLSYYYTVPYSTLRPSISAAAGPGKWNAAATLACYRRPRTPDLDVIHGDVTQISCASQTPPFRSHQTASYRHRKTKL